MKRLSRGLAITAALVSGCSSIEQGSAIRESSPYSAAICPAIPEALANATKDELMNRLGSAILACAKDTKGTVDNDRRLATVRLNINKSEVTFFVRSSASPSNADDFARGTYQVSLTRQTGQDMISSAGLNNNLWQIKNQDHALYSDQEKRGAGLMEGSLYKEYSTEQQVIDCTEQKIVQEAAVLAAAGVYGGGRAHVGIPETLPKNCDAV